MTVGTKNGVDKNVTYIQWQELKWGSDAYFTLQDHIMFG